MIAPCKVFRNPGNSCSWNPESLASSFPWQGIQNLQCRIQNPRLSWIALRRATSENKTVVHYDSFIITSWSFPLCFRERSLMSLSFILQQCRVRIIKRHKCKIPVRFKQWTSRCWSHFEQNIGKYNAIEHRLYISAHYSLLLRSSRLITGWART